MIEPLRTHLPRNNERKCRPDAFWRATHWKKAPCSSSTLPLDSLRLGSRFRRYTHSGAKDRASRVWVQPGRSCKGIGRVDRATPWSLDVRLGALFHLHYWFRVGPGQESVRGDQRRCHPRVRRRGFVDSGGWRGPRPEQGVPTNTWTVLCVCILSKLTVEMAVVNCYHGSVVNFCLHLGYPCFLDYLRHVHAKRCQHCSRQSQTNINYTQTFLVLLRHLHIRPRGDPSALPRACGLDSDHGRPDVLPLRGWAQNGKYSPQTVFCPGLCCSFKNRRCLVSCKLTFFFFSVSFIPHPPTAKRPHPQVRINSNTWLRMNADEDTYKDPMLAGGSSGETTTMKRINSHTQLFTREAGTEKKRE